MNDGFDPRLGRAFDFTADDLSANRSGRLSADQQAMFAHAVRVGERRERRVTPVLLVLLVAVVALVVVVTSTDDDSDSAGPALAVVGGMLAFLTVLVVLFRRRDATARRTMAVGTVETVEGPWVLDTSLDGTWRIRVQDRLVAADRLAVDTLDTDGVYRFHLLPYPKVAAVLSVERVTPPRA